ncbi:MAG: hypothetical protein ACK2T3_04775 [Candidatus Promineifilaceae bacterium]
MGKLTAHLFLVLTVILLACGGATETIEDAHPTELADTAASATNSQKTPTLYGTEWELATRMEKTMSEEDLQLLMDPAKQKELPSLDYGVAAPIFYLLFLAYRMS